MSSKEISADAKAWKQIMLVAAFFLLIIVLSGIVLVVFSDFFLSLGL